MKAIMKFLRNIFLGLVVILIFHNWTIKTIFALGLRLGLAAPVDIEAAHLDFFNQKMTFEGLLIKNPSGFPRGILAEIPKITVSFDGNEVQKGYLHFYSVEVEIEELRIIRAEGGKMNLLGLKVFRPSSGGNQSKSPNQEKPRFQMDKAIISLNRVTYTDLSGPTPIQQSFKLGIQKAILDHPSLEGVVEAIVQESIQTAGLQKVLEEAIRSFGLRDLMSEANGGWKSLVAKAKTALA